MVELLRDRRPELFLVVNILAANAALDARRVSTNERGGPPLRTIPM